MVARRIVTALLRFSAVVVLGAGSPLLAATQAFTLTTPALATFPTTVAGVSSAPQALVLTATRTVTISSIAISSAINSHAEFSVGTTAGCSSLATGGTCTIPVTFKPFYTGVRQATLTVTDSTGTVYSVGLSGLGTGPQGLLSPGYVNYNGTTAGSSFAGDGGPLSTARFGLITGTTVDASGNWYIADTSTHNVRVVYQSGAALACLIEIEEPTLFGLTAGSTSCAGATSAPVAGDIYTIGGDPTPYSGTVTTHAYGSNAAVLATAISGTTSTLYTPEGLAVDAAGNVIIGDYGSYTVRVIYSGGDNMACLIELENPTLFGLASTANTCTGATSAPIPGYLYNIGGIASTPGIIGDGTGKATAAEMANVIGIAVSPAGDIFLTDNSVQAARSARIRVIFNGGAQAAALITAENPGITLVPGYIYRLLGGVQISGGDGGLAYSPTAGMLFSRGIALDSDGDVVFTDYIASGSISGVNPEGKVRVIYNGGVRMGALIAKEEPQYPTPVEGFLYTLSGNNTVSNGVTGLNGPASAAVLNEPWGVTVDPAGNIYVADQIDLQLYKIGVNDGLLTNFVGQGYNATKSLASGNALTKASLYGPFGVAFGSDGTVYFNDENVYHVRTDTAQAAPITFTTSAAIGNVSETEVVYFTNVGNAPSTIASITPSTNFAQEVSGQSVYPDCKAGTLLAVGTTCAIGVALSPTVANQTLTGTLTVTDNSQQATYTVALTGVSAVQTVTTISSSNLSINAGSPVTFSSNVSIAPGQTVPSSAPALAGTVTFKYGTTTIGTAQAIDVNGNASVTTSAIPGGTQTITANFGPATGDYSPSSAKLTETVTAVATATTVTTSFPNADPGASVTLTATVVIPTGTTVPSGTPALAGGVTFTDVATCTSGTGSGTTTLGSNIAISSAGVATVTSSTLCIGSHAITAVFTPSAINYASSTGTYTQVVASPSWTVSTTSLGVAVPTSGSVAVPFTFTAVGGYKGVITQTCSTLPTNVSCSFTPNTLALTGDGTYTSTLTIGTSGVQAMLDRHSEIEVAALFGAAVLLLLPRRRRRGMVALAALLLLAASAGVVGCSKGPATAARGTFNVIANFTDGTTTTSVPVTVSVLGNP